MASTEGAMMSKIETLSEDERGLLIHECRGNAHADSGALLSIDDAVAKALRIMDAQATRIAELEDSRLKLVHLLSAEEDLREAWQTRATQLQPRPPASALAKAWMTAHELAHVLLAGPDYIAVIPAYESGWSLC